MMKCPKCGFEQIEDSPDECAKCGILFEKWLNRDVAPVEAATGPAVHSGPPPRIWVYPPGRVIWGTRLCQLGVLMVALPILSFAINIIGFEFILLMPLENFDNPTVAKLSTMGIGVVILVIGSALGGETPEEYP